MLEKYGKLLDERTETEINAQQSEVDSQFNKSPDQE